MCTSGYTITLNVLCDVLKIVLFWDFNPLCNTSSKFRVTIEPALFMGVTAMYVTYLSKQNLLLEKVCRVNLNYSDDICDALAERNSNATPEYDEVLKEVEHYVTGINTWSFIIGKELKKY